MIPQDIDVCMDMTIFLLLDQVCNVRIHGMPSWRQHMSGKKHQTVSMKMKT